MTDLFVAASDHLFGVALFTLGVYLTVFVGLRVAGRRTVSQMSAFDLVITFAIGSLVATTVVSDDVSYARSLTALATLLVVQQVLAFARQRSHTAQRLIDFPPEVVYENGRWKLRSNPLSAQVTQDEVESELRSKGLHSLDRVERIVLEPSGGISVLLREDAEDVDAD